MNNTIQTIQNNGVEEFVNSRMKNKNARDFWIPAQTNNGEDIYSTGNTSKIFITPEDARKTNNTRVIGLSIAGATITAAAGVFFILKGGPKGMAKGFRKLRNHIEHKIYTSKLNTNSAPNKLLLYILKATDTALAHADAINNFTTFKDVLFKKFMGVTKVTENIHNRITNIFGKIGRKTVKNSYSSTSAKFDEIKTMSSEISNKIRSMNPDEHVEINGVVMTKNQWLKRIKDLNNEIAADFGEHFTDRALLGRLKHMMDTVNNLYDKFKNMGVFWSKDTLTSFMAEAQMIQEKNTIQKAVRDYRKGISYNLSDMLESSNRKILDISRELGYKDTEHINKLGSILGKIKAYVHDGGFDRVKKELILSSINSLKRDIELGHNTIKPEQANILLAKFEDLYSGIAKFKQGKVQDILDIYKKLLPAEEYEIVARKYKNCVNSLDKSIKIETEDYMSKLRDLTLGSAPTDILTILTSFGVLGYHLGKSKDSDQRQSIALKYGIPALAGIGVSLYCNAKLFAGSKSLAVGAISTWILNRIGELSDNKLKEFKARKTAQQKQ